jgi:hypothetical protein
MWNQDLPIYGQIVAPAHDQPQCMKRFLMRALLPLRLMPAQRFHHRDARHHRIASTLRM